MQLFAFAHDSVFDYADECSAAAVKLSLKRKLVLTAHSMATKLLLSTQA
jgi:hypothetical protein